VNELYARYHDLNVLTPSYIVGTRAGVIAYGYTITDKLATPQPSAPSGLISASPSPCPPEDAFPAHITHRISAVLNMGRLTPDLTEETLYGFDIEQWLGHGTDNDVW